jgi:hypothetical protein
MKNNKMKVNGKQAENIVEEERAKKKRKKGLIGGIKYR